VSFPRRSHSAITATAVALACLCVGDVDSAAGLSWSASLNVAAVIDQRCSIVAGNIAFGTYDYSGTHATTPLDATGTINLDCEAGRRADVRLDQGLNPDPGSTDEDPLRQLNNGTGGLLPYNLYEDAAHTVVWDNQPRGVLSPLTFPVLMTVYARIPAGTPVQTGAYVDTVVATVYF
jgi:spore coat protein U-like protein